MYLLEIRVWQNLAKLGGECTAGRNFGGVSICVVGFSQFHFVFFETENVGKRSFRWLAYRSPSAIFVYHAPIGLHEALPQAFPSGSFFCLTSFKLCCVLARLHSGLRPAERFFGTTFRPKLGSKLQARSD